MKNKDISLKIFSACNFILMTGIFLITLLPYMHVLAKALNEGNDTLLGGLSFWPRKFTWANFVVLIKDESMIRAFILTVVRVIVGTILCVTVQFASAYALSKRSLPGSRYLMLFMAIPMFFSGGLIPTYILFVNLKLINSFWVYIIPMVCSYYNVLVLRSYIVSSVPESLSEAAYLEGAGEVRTMWEIVLPLSKPVIATVALWIAVGHWNDWNSTLMYVTKPDLYTLQYKLMQLIKESERIQSLVQDAAMSGSTEANLSIQATPDSLISAQVVITTLPIIMVYPFIQKYFMKGITLGAVK